MFFPADPVAAPELASKIVLTAPPVDVTFNHFLPYVRVRERAGDLTYMTKNDLSGKSIQKNRADGSAIEEIGVGTGKCAYTLNRYEKRVFVPELEESNYEDETNLRDAGGSMLAGVFFRGLETGFVTYLNTAVGEAAQMEEGSVIDAISAAADALRPWGVPRIVMTDVCFRKFKNLPEVRARLKEMGATSMLANYITGKPDAVRTAITDLTGVDEIVIASGEVWTATYDDQFFMCAVRPEMLNAGHDVIGTIKAKPCGGFIPYTVPPANGVDKFAPATIRCWGDMAKKRNYFDADAAMSFVNLDADSIKRFKLPVLSPAL